MSEGTFNCPKCKAESTQAIAMLLQTGIHRGSSATSMTGLGFSGGGLGVGVGSAVTSSHSASDLARKYMMPPRPFVSTAGLILGIVFTVISLPVLAATFAFSDPEVPLGCLRYPSAGLLIAGLILLASHPSKKKEQLKVQAQWDERKAYIQRTWVCFRCGQEWQP